MTFKEGNKIQTNELHDGLLKLLKEDFPTREIIDCLKKKYNFYTHGSIIEGLPEFERYIHKNLPEKDSIDYNMPDSFRILKLLAEMNDVAAKRMLEPQVKKILENKELRSIIMLFNDDYFKFLPNDYVKRYVSSFTSNHAVKAMMQKCIKSEDYEINEQVIHDLLSIDPYLNLFLISRGPLIQSLLIDILTTPSMKMKFLSIFEERMDKKENSSQLLEVMINFLSNIEEEKLISLLGKELHRFYGLVYNIVEFDKKKMFGHLEMEHIVKGSMSKFISEKIIEEIEKNDFDRFYLTYKYFFECINKPDLIKFFLENGIKFFTFILSNLTENGYEAINESEFFFSLKSDPDVIDSMRHVVQQLLRNYKFKEDNPIFNLEILDLVDSRTLQDLLNNPESGFFESLLYTKGRWGVDYYHKFLNDKNLSFKTRIYQVFKSNKVEDISLFWKYWVWNDLKISELKWLFENKDLNFLEKVLKNAYHCTDDYFFDFYYVIPDRVKTHLRPQLKESVLQLLNKTEIDSFVPLLAMRLLDCFDPKELLSIIDDNEINLLERIDEAIEDHYDKIMELNEGFYRWKINFYKLLSKFNVPISDTIDRLEAAETLVFQLSPQDEEVEDFEYKIQATSHIEEHVEIAGRKIKVINGILDLSGLNIYALETVENLFELKSLRILSLSNNFLTELPSTIGDLTSLEKILIEKCKINELPESIGDLKSLKHLNLHRNQINHFPKSFGNLKKMERLDASFNNISYIPVSFKKLTSLKVLNLRNNSIKTIPEWIGEFQNLKVLNLMVNSLLSNLPLTIGKLVSLELLNLSSTWINKIPKSIGNLKDLKILHLSYTHINEIPESIGNLQSLEDLYLSSDRVISLPKTILECTSLSYLNVGRKTFEHNEDLIRTLEENGVTVYH